MTISTTEDHTMQPIMLTIVFLLWLPSISLAAGKCSGWPPCRDGCVIESKFGDNGAVDLSCNEPQAKEEEILPGVKVPTTFNMGRPEIHVGEMAWNVDMKRWVKILDRRETPQFESGLGYLIINLEGRPAWFDASFFWSKRGLAATMDRSLGTKR